MRASLCALAALLVCVTSHAKDCVVIPAQSACGVPLGANPAAFEAALGAPDGRVNMGANRVGWLYGTNFVVIFWHGKLWEIQNWQRPIAVGPTDWLGYVGFGRPDRETRVRFAGWNPWQDPEPTDSRAQRDMPILAGDGAGQLRRLRGGSVQVAFNTEGTEPGQARTVSYLKVNFGREASSP